MPKCKITVIKKGYDPELAREYCSNPEVGPCSVFEVGQEIVVDMDSYFKMNIGDRFCSEAWSAISHYVYAALQGGSIMKGWMQKENEMITCCNDGVRPVVFKLERIDDGIGSDMK